MRIIIILIFLVPLNSNCRENMVGKNPEVTHFYHEFMHDYTLFYQEKMRDVTLFHCKRPNISNLLGICFGIGYGDIVLYNSFFKLPKKLQKLVIYHELGHCVLGLWHVDHGLDIMNSYLSKDNVYDIIENWDVLKTDMFLRGYMYAPNQYQEKSDILGSDCTRLIN